MAAAALIATWVGPARAIAAPVQARTAYRTECGTPHIDTGARTCSYTFPYTATIETFVVPPTTAPVQITAVGAPGGGGGGCAGADAEGNGLCLDSQPGSGGGGSSLLPPGGSFVLSDNLVPSVTITVTHYGWWGAHP